MDEITIAVHKDPSMRSTTLVARFTDIYAAAIGPSIQGLVLERIAEAIAAEYLKTHLQDILAAMDPNAVANLAVADAAAAIRKSVDGGVENLRRDIARPREVLTPGLFGTKRSIIR